MAEKSEIRLNLLEPRATEKTYNEQTKRVYVFPVEREMSKQAIAAMVEKEFNVTVTDVKIRKGKKTRYSKGKRAYPGTTYRRDRKFAYVRLKQGDSIKVFEEENNQTSAKEAKAREKLLERAEKVAEKEAAREEKAAAKAEKMAAKAEKAKADKNAGKEKK